MREEFVRMTGGSRACPVRKRGIGESAEGVGVREGTESTLVARAVLMIADSIAAPPPLASDPPVSMSSNNPGSRSLDSPSGGLAWIGLWLEARNSHVPPVRATVRSARVMTNVRRTPALYSRRRLHASIHGASPPITDRQLRSSTGAGVL